MKSGYLPAFASDSRAANAKLLIFLLTLSVSNVYLTLWQLRSQLYLQNQTRRQFKVKQVTNAKKPVLYMKRRHSIEVFRDVCWRWGYDLVVSSHTAPDLSTHEEPFLNRYLDNMSYRIFQNETEDKIVDYLAKVRELIIKKSNLVRRGGKYIPTSFILPEEVGDFLRYVNLPQNRETLWMEKDLIHQGNILKPVTDMDPDKPCIVQEFIRNPFTVDGRKFSIGVYVGFASANPLRVYVLDSELKLRFACERYYPEHLADPKTYITDGQHHCKPLLTAEVEPLKTYSQKHQYTNKKAFDAFMIAAGKDPNHANEAYRQIYDAIRDVLNTNVKVVEKHSDPETKYVMFTRWDFLLDDNMTVHHLESNCNPGLSCRWYPENGPHICHHIVYNTLRAMGLEKPFQWKHNRAFYIRDTDVQIADEVCYTTICDTCGTRACVHCTHCLSPRQRRVLKEVLREHLHRGETRLVQPDTTTNESNNVSAKSGPDLQMTDRDVLIYWLKTKCNNDTNWCFPYS